MPPGSLTKYIQGKELPALHILGEGQENSDSRWPVPVRGKGPSLVRGHRKRWHDCIAPLVLNAN